MHLNDPLTLYLRTPFGEAQRHVIGIFSIQKMRVKTVGNAVSCAPDAETIKNYY